MASGRSIHATVAAAAAIIVLTLQGRAEAAEAVYDFSLSGTYNGNPVTALGAFSIDTSETAGAGGSYFGNFDLQAVSATITGFPEITADLSDDFTAYQQLTFAITGRASTVFVGGTETGNPSVQETLTINLAPIFTDFAVLDIGEDVLSASLTTSGGNVTGMGVNLTGTLTALPEPAAWIEMFAGLAFVGGLARRRGAVSRSASAA